MFGSKTKGVFVELSEGYLRLAQTTSIRPPCTLEQLIEIPIGTEAEAASQIREVLGTKGNGYSQGVCAVYPTNRLVSRVTIDPRKFQDADYLEKHVQETLKIETSAYNLFTLSRVDGSDVSLLKNPPRDILVCGAPVQELMAEQERLLELGIYPDRMEIGTVASIGGIINNLISTDSRSPTLVLEVGTDSTNVFVVTREGVEVTRSVAFGISSIIPQVQRELGLKDEEAARKLFFSNTFDFTGMAPQLLKRIIRELQASIGFYEVQTGQSVTQLCCTLLPPPTIWMEKALADVMGMKTFSINYREWLAAMSIDCAPGVDLNHNNGSWTSLISLLGDFKTIENEAAA